MCLTPIIEKEIRECNANVPGSQNLLDRFLQTNYSNLQRLRKIEIAEHLMRADKRLKHSSCSNDTHIIQLTVTTQGSESVWTD